MGGAWGRTRSERGQSLLEVMVALTLMSFAAVTLAGALIAVTKVSDVNEQRAQVDSALLGYGEVVRSQLVKSASDPAAWNTPRPLDADGYRDCDANTASYYQTDAARRIVDLPAPAGASTTVSTTSPIRTTAWRKPADMTVQVLSVVNWNSNTGSWAPGCLSPDPGIQRVTIKVTWDPADTTTPPEERTAQIIKRRPGPAS